MTAAADAAEATDAWVCKRMADSWRKRDFVVVVDAVTIDKLVSIVRVGLLQDGYRKVRMDGREESGDLP